MLSTEFANFEKGPDFRFQMKSLLGTGVFNSDGQLFSSLRVLRIISNLSHRGYVEVSKAITHDRPVTDRASGSIVL